MEMDISLQPKARASTMLVGPWRGQTGLTVRPDTHTPTPSHGGHRNMARPREICF